MGKKAAGVTTPISSRELELICKARHIAGKLEGLREAAELIEDYKPQILRAQKGLSVEDNIQMAIDYVLDELFKVVLAHIAELEKP